MRFLVGPGGAAIIVLGRLLAPHLDAAAILDAERHHVGSPALDLIARKRGRGWYARNTDLFEIGRPDQGTTS